MLSELLSFNIEMSDVDFTEFFETCNKLLNYHTPCKQKYVRGNHLPFMNKSLSKEIMKKKHALGINFEKIEIKKTKLGIQNKEATVYH